MVAQKLTEDERNGLLKPLCDKDGWALTKTSSGAESISKEYQFKDFKIAFAFMTTIAKYADEKDHHPDWHNLYNTVEILLSTHECSGLSTRDIEFAKYADKVQKDF